MEQTAAQKSSADSAVFALFGSRIVDNVCDDKTKQSQMKADTPVCMHCVLYVHCFYSHKEV